MTKLFIFITLIFSIILKIHSIPTEDSKDKIFHIHINNDTEFDELKLEKVARDNVNNYDFVLPGSNVQVKEIDAMNNNNQAGSPDNFSDGILEESKQSSTKNFIVVPLVGCLVLSTLFVTGYAVKKKYMGHPSKYAQTLSDHSDDISQILVQAPASTKNKRFYTLRQTKEDDKYFKTLCPTKKNVAFLPINHAYKATLPWTPKHIDEVELSMGDLVCIKKCYSDGYSYGRNVTSRVDGVFPTCCLSTMDESIDQEKIENWINSGINNIEKRTASLFVSDSY